MPRPGTASRVIAVPPGRVCSALAGREDLTAWPPPGGMTGAFEPFDSRSGGSYRMVYRYAATSGCPWAHRLQPLEQGRFPVSTLRTSHVGAHGM
jgi:uncharacterized protein YndB with AHSA1/START domain